MIAFPMREGEFSSLQPHLIGDVAISVETAMRQSKQFGLNDREMVLYLMIHGILHLIGYEHEGKKKGAREMASKERDLFRSAVQALIEDPESSKPVEAF